ncbi:Protein of unknown function DUF192 [Rivularia sp. IAM M-261]|nr:Protein of unknown function DUF192 [Rivularia sp. IAM M-261]
MILNKMRILNSTKSQKGEELFLKIINKIGPIAGITVVILPLALYLHSRQPQKLPIGASFTVNNQTIQLEVAREPQELYKGLKFRTALPPNHGMLFVVNKPEIISLWMKDTYVHLDMVFLKDGEIKNIVRKAPPCTTKECPSYSSNYPVNQIIELPAGSADSLGLNIGKSIQIKLKQ